MKNVFYIFLILIVSVSCRKDEKISVLIDNLEPFTKVEVNSSLDVYLAEDSVFAVAVTGYIEQVDNIKVVVENGILKISDERKMKFLKPGRNSVKVEIHSGHLNQVRCEECFLHTLNPITTEDEFGLIFTGKACKAELELNCHVFYYWNNFPCGGMLTLTGKTDELKIWNFAITSVDARNTETDYADIGNNSKGDISVNVPGILEYYIKGEGNIHLWGEPDTIIEHEVSSTGRLIKHY